MIYLLTNVILKITDSSDTHLYSHRRTPRFSRSRSSDSMQHVGSRGKTLCLARSLGDYEYMRGLVAQSRLCTVSTYRKEDCRDWATLWALMVSCSMWTRVE